MGTSTLENIHKLSHQRNLEGHVKTINGFSYFEEPGKNYLVSASEEHIKVWDLKKPEHENTSTLSSSVYIATMTTFHKKFLACAGLGNNDIEVWDLEKNKLDYTLKGHRNYVYALTQYQKNGEQYLASGSWDFSIKLWNVSSKSCIYTLQGHSGYVISLNTYVEDGEIFLASGSFDCSIKLWNLERNSLIATLGGGSHCIRKTIIFYKEKVPYLASGSEDRTIKIWNLKNHKLEVTLTGYSDFVYSLVSFHKYLVIGSHDRTIEIWDFEKYNLLKVLKVPTPARCFTTFRDEDDKSYLISGHENGKIMVWSE